MLVPRRVKATALVTALGVHAGLFTAVLSHAPDLGTRTTGNRAVRVSIGGSGQTPVDTATESPAIQEVATVASVGINTVPTISAKESSEGTATPISLETAKIVEAGPATGLVIKELPPDSVIDNSLTVEGDKISAIRPVVDPKAMDALKSAESVVTVPSVEVTPPQVPPTPLLIASTADGNPLKPIKAVGSANPVMPGSHPETPPTPIKVSNPSETVVPFPAREPVSLFPSSVTSELMAVDAVTTQEPAETDAATPITLPQEVNGVREQPVQLTSANPTSQMLPLMAENGRTSQPMTSIIGTGPLVETIGIAAAHKSYLEKLHRHLMRFKRYPRAARRHGVTGVATVRFIILADGSLRPPQLIVSSGDDRLDQAALRMLARARPFPPFPANLNKVQLELNLPIEFSLTPKHGLF